MWLLGGDFVGYENRTFGLEGNVILQIYWDSSGPWYMSATYWDCRRHHSANIYIYNTYIYIYIYISGLHQSESFPALTPCRFSDFNGPHTRVFKFAGFALTCRVRM